jgi:hypothetical protein
VTDEPEDLGVYGLETPQITLSLWENKTETPQQLLLGRADVENAGIYAKLGDQDSVVLVDSEALEQFKKTAFDLRYQKILSFESKQIEKIQIKYPDTTLLLEKDGDIWKSKEPEEKELLSYKINNLLYDLENLEFQAEHVTPDEDLSVYGLTEPHVTITLWEEKDKEVFTLLVGKPGEEQNHLSVKTTTEKTIHTINRSFLDELPKEIADLTE